MEKETGHEGKKVIDEFKLIGFGARRGRNHGRRANMDLDVPTIFMTSREALEKSQGAY